MMTKVLFVCTGNICRSPSAEGVFRHLIKEAGLAEVVGIDSAGTHNFHLGEGADPRALAAARKRGYEIAEHVARQVCESGALNGLLGVAIDDGEPCRVAAPALVHHRLAAQHNMARGVQHNGQREACSAQHATSCLPGGTAPRTEIPGDLPLDATAR